MERDPAELLSKMVTFAVTDKQYAQLVKDKGSDTFADYIRGKLFGDGD